MIYNYCRTELGCTFNPLTTEAALFDLFPQLVFDNILIGFEDRHKDMGVTLSSNGKWHSPIEDSVHSSSKTLGVMKY